MIKASLQSRGQLLEGLHDYLVEFNGIVFSTNREVADELLPAAVDALRVEPPPSPWGEGNPLPWTSDAQHNAFFASAGFGGGIPHQRSGDMAAGWEGTNDGQGRTEIANAQPGAGFVYGSLAASNPGLHQQAFLILGGWPTAYPIVKQVMDAIAAETLARVRVQFGSFGFRRGTSFRG